MITNKIFNDIKGIALIIVMLICEQIILLFNELATNSLLKLIVIALNIIAITIFSLIYRHVLKTNQQYQYNTKALAPLTRKKFFIIIKNALLLFAWQIIANALLMKWHLTKNVNQSNVSTELHQQFFIIMVIIIAPIMEEFIFRGYFFAFFFHKHQFLGMLVSGMFFAICHCINAFEWYNFVFYSIAGVILARTYLVSHDIRCDIVVHLLNNLLSCL